MSNTAMDKDHDQNKGNYLFDIESEALNKFLNEQTKEHLIKTIKIGLKKIEELRIEIMAKKDVFNILENQHKEYVQMFGGLARAVAKEKNIKSLKERRNKYLKKERKNGNSKSND